MAVKSMTKSRTKSAKTHSPKRKNSKNTTSTVKNAVVFAAKTVSGLVSSAAKAVKETVAKATTPKLNSLDDLLIDELKDLYSAEHQLVKALPKMAKKASHSELREAFEEHLAVTRGQVDRLEKVFKLLETSPRGKTCKAMEGLVKEGDELMHETAAPAVMDAALICAAQKVEHYEIASYGCVRSFANLLGYAKVAKLLQETLDEEGEADKTLTALAESAINNEAEGQDEKSEAASRNGHQKR